MSCKEKQYAFFFRSPRDGKDEFLVFDAKYKRMKGEKNDVDRSDFFQIHTYIQYFLHTYPEGRVLLGGLLYPLSLEDWKETERFTHRLPCLVPLVVLIQSSSSTESCVRKAIIRGLMTSIQWMQMWRQ